MARRVLIFFWAMLAMTVPLAAQDANTAKPYFAAKDLYQIFVLGDSLAAGLWSGMSRSIEGDTRISLNGRYKEDSGLSRPEYYDWNGALPKILESNKIDIAIVMIGSNDAQPIRDDRIRYAFETPEWREAYIKQVDRLIASLKAAGAAVYWVELPPMEAPKYNDSMRMISAIQEERAKAAGIRFVATRSELTDNDRYSDSGFNDAGEFVRLRSRDGVHFLKEGNNKLAGLVIAEINKDIEAAVAAAPQTPPEATGEDLVPGDGPMAVQTPGGEIAQPPPAKSDFAGALPVPADPVMAELARTTRPGSDASRLFSRGEAIAIRPGRFDDFTPVE